MASITIWWHKMATDVSIYFMLSIFFLAFIWRSIFVICIQIHLSNFIVWQIYYIYDINVISNNNKIVINISVIVECNVVICVCWVQKKWRRIRRRRNPKILAIIPLLFSFFLRMTFFLFLFLFFSITQWMILPKQNIHLLLVMMVIKKRRIMII